MSLIFLLKQVCENTAQAPCSILFYHKTLPVFIILHTSNCKAATYGHTVSKISITIQLGFLGCFTVAVSIQVLWRLHPAVGRVNRAS